MKIIGKYYMLLLMIVCGLSISTGVNAKRLTYVNAKTWDTVKNPRFFPEVEGPLSVPWLKDKRSFGIAFSGGGTRSATATLGQLRALNELG
jgi:hypothetical protein